MCWKFSNNPCRSAFWQSHTWLWRRKACLWMPLNRPPPVIGDHKISNSVKILLLLKKKSVFYLKTLRCATQWAQSEGHFIVFFHNYFFHISLFFSFQDFFLLCWTWRQWQTSQLMPLVAHSVRKCSASWWSTCQDSPSATLSVESVTRGVSNRLVGRVAQTRELQDETENEEQRVTRLNPD